MTLRSKDLCTMQGWRHKFYDREAGASDRGAKMTEKLCFRALFCQICSEDNPKFSSDGGAVAPPSPPLAPPLAQSAYNNDKLPSVFEEYFETNEYWLSQKKV